MSGNVMFCAFKYFVCGMFIAINVCINLKQQLSGVVNSTVLLHTQTARTLPI
jgi:hypothetical protein